MAKVLITINASWNIVNFRSGLIQGLQAAGHEVTSAAPNDGYTDKLKTLVTQHFSLPMQNAGTSFFHDLLLLFRYISILHTAKPDVILAYTIKPNIYASFAARWLGIPIINNVSGLGTAFIRDNWLTRIAKLLYRLAFRYSSCVFFQNPEDLELFIRYKLVRPEKTTLIPGSGIDLDYFKPVPKQSKDVSFLLIARMLWDKGIGEFVEAAQIVKKQYPDARCRLLGPREVQNKTAISGNTINEWEKENKIEYLGEKEDVREMIAENDCVVLPSYREGMSRVLLEAAAMGKPLIATNVPGCKHVIDDKHNGFLCRVRDAEDLAQVMINFLKLSPEERTRMGTASRTMAEQRFDQKFVIDAYLEKIRAATSV